MLARKCITIVPHEVLWIQDWLLGIYAWNNLISCSNVGISFWYGFSANGNYLLRIHRYAKIDLFLWYNLPFLEVLSTKKLSHYFRSSPFWPNTSLSQSISSWNFQNHWFSAMTWCFYFIFFATCAEAMPNQCSSANNIRGYFSQVRKCYSTSVTELLTSFQLIYGKWALPSVGPSPNTNWLLLLHLHLALWLPWVTKTEFLLTILSRQEMSLKKNINNGIINWSNTKFSKVKS